MRYLRSLLLVVGLLALGFVPVAEAQTAINTTTLSSAVNTVTTRVTVASISTVAVGDNLFVDAEVMRVVAVPTSGTTLTVVRGFSGTAPTAHPSGRYVWTGTPNRFTTTGSLTSSTGPAGAGSCASTDIRFTPVIDIQTGRIYSCVNSLWVGTTFNPFADAAWPRTVVGDVAYTAKITDVYIGFSSLSVSRTLTLPLFTGLPPRFLIVQDESGSMSTVVILTLSGTINGTSSALISAAYGTQRLFWNGTAWFRW